MSTKKLLCILASVVLAVTLLTFGAVAADYVAEIDGIQYETVEAAFSAATSGDTITLLSNATTSIRITVSTTVTLDLNGYTLSGSGFTVNGGNLSVTGGRISGTQPFNVYGGSADQANYSVLTIDSNVTISEATWGICLFPQSNSEKLGYGATINMYGIIASTTSDSNGIFVSGNLGNSTETSDAMAKSDNVSVVNIYGTIDTVSQAVAMNGYAVVNVYSGATISGSEAIGVKRGVLNVYGGTLYATGSYIDPATANYNGTEDTGAAISVTSTYNYAGEIVVNVYDGTIKSYYGNAVYVGHSSSNSSSTTYTEGVTVVLYGGTYTGSSSAGAVYVAEAISGDASTYTQYVVCGGTYSSDITSYISEETGLIQDSTGAVVTAPSVASVNGTKYASLQAAINAAGTSGTVTLLKDTAEDIVIKEGQTITLNLNGHTLTNVSGDTITVELGANLTIEGGGTVDNVTHQKAAIANNGTVTLNGGTYTRSLENGQSSTDNGGNSFYTIINHGTMTINDGVTVTQDGHYSSMIENGYQDYNGGNARSGYVAGTNSANPTLTINGGTFTGGLNTVKNDDGGTLVINGGSFSNTTQATILNWNEATINDGTFVSTAYVVLNGYGDDTLDKGELTINGGTFTAGSGYSVISEFNSSYGYGTITIYSGTFTTGNTDIFNITSGNTGTITIYGGTYSVDVPDEYIANGLDAVQLSSGYWVIGGTEAQITIASYSNGKVTTDPTGTAVSGQTVTITATPESGYYKAKIIVTDANGKSVDVTDNLDGTYSFTMPNSAVTVSVSFVRVKDEISGIFYVNESYHGIMVNGHLLSIPHTVNEAGYCTTCGAYIGVEEEEVDLEEGVTEEVVEVEDPVESGETDSEDDGEEAPAETPAEEETNPTTGVALGLIPMAIAAVAVAVSKKH